MMANVIFHWGTGIPSKPEEGHIYVDETNEMMYICIDDKGNMIGLF